MGPPEGELPSQTSAALSWPWEVYDVLGAWLCTHNTHTHIYPYMYIHTDTPHTYTHIHIYTHTYTYTHHTHSNYGCLFFLSYYSIY